MANNVTFVIGNGLDVSLGLNTSYRNFYKYVKENKLHPENSIYKAIAKDNPEWWADFELGLGRFTNSIETVTEKERKEWSRVLNEELDEIKKDLKLYVKEQNSHADEHIQKIKFTKSSFYNGLEVGQIANVTQRISGNNPLALRFVTLNYTDVLERVFKSVGLLVLGKDYYVASPIHHIHGSITRKISLGVNDESQISSYIVPEEKNYLIKPELIRLMNDGRIETLTEYINNTDVMVFFGTSLGATDKYIWELVAEWLGQGNKLLIIHHFERGLDVSDLTERESLQLSNRVKNKFLDYSSIDDNRKDSMKRQIYVIPNSSELFSVSN